jgi:hypothetical protein
MSKIEWKGKQLSDAVKKSGLAGLKDAAEFLLDEALKIVPIDESTLANSGNTSVDENSMTAAVFFDTPYAVTQHEDLTLNHKNGRQSKYLENPAKENRKKMQGMIANSIKGEL